MRAQSIKRPSINILSFHMPRKAKAAKRIMPAPTPMTAYPIYFTSNAWANSESCRSYPIQIITDPIPYLGFTSMIIQQT
ncbi:unnamed protein product [Blepharisma stoltei]|uniref:Uncharacterized protein n=1 Tax=Blepharisma stoltei TaxID=1481888 RepID=A0AAU9JAD2_9CILI|nr:unnamed protein product [Blepharisma stoltei]